MKKPTAPQQPALLAAGILEDNGRALFLCRRLKDGTETVELPCVLLGKGENPVGALTLEFKRQTGIDGEVGEVLFERRFNAGSKKRKFWIPALAFEVTAKNATARPSAEFSGYKWIYGEDLGKHRLARICSWLR